MRSRKPSTRPFDNVERCLAAFTRAEGFKLYTSTWHLYRISDCEPPGLSYSFLESIYDGRRAAVTVHGSTRTQWHRHMVNRLKKAGYQVRHRSAHETECHRWLLGERAAMRELAFLRAIGTEGAASRWPVRKVIGVPVRKDRRGARGGGVTSGAKVRTANIGWNERVVAFERRGEARRLRQGDLQVGVLLVVMALEGPFEPPSLTIDVQLYPIGDRHKALPAKILRSGLRDLRALGYRTRNAVVRADVADQPAGFVFVSKEVPSVGAALGECTRIFDRLTR
jgi:hypothetical protein